MEYGLSLGSNKGDRLSNLMAAVEQIAQIHGVTILERSKIYETQPVDVPEDYISDIFLNCVIIIETQLTPRQMLKILQKLEADMGREPDHGHNTPRIIDIDIIYADDYEIDSPDLTIPHPNWNQRRFVVEPLYTLRPELVIPKAERPVKDILNSLPENPKVDLHKE